MQAQRIRGLVYVSAFTLFAVACGQGPDRGPVAAPSIGAESEVVTARPPAVRLIAPLSGSLSGATRPRLRVQGAPIAIVQICADRACTKPLQDTLAVDGAGRPLRPLATGAVFWRARSILPRASWTAAWELFVPPGGSAPDSTRGLRFDADADGFTDAVVRDQNGEAGTDRLHVYRGGSSGLDPTTDTQIPLDTTHFGTAAVAAGDVNGDGFGDIALSDGRGVVVYAGSAKGITTTPLTVVPVPAGIQPPPQFAAHLVAGGDVNGDGYGNLFVDDTFKHVWLYLGSATGLETTPAWIFDVSSDSNRFTSLLTAGDLNGDGFADLVVNDYTTGDTITESFRFFRGGADGLESPDAGTAIVRPNHPSGIAGDVNGDGIPDLVDSEVTQLAYFPGGAAFPPADATEVVPVANRALPLQLVDFNGDGFADLAAKTAVQNGTLYFTDDRIDVYPGSAAGFAPTPTVTILEASLLPDDTLNFGEVLSGGDYDRDGHDDLLVAAAAAFPTPVFDTSKPRVFVFDGSAAGLQPNPALTITGSPGFGDWVSSAAPQFP